MYDETSFVDSLDRGCLIGDVSKNTYALKLSKVCRPQSSRARIRYQCVH